MEEQPDVEILVHIRAPSRAVDDARYRSLAAAYLAFEPIEPVHFCPQSCNDSDIEDSRHALITDEDEESFDISLDGRIGAFESPQASFRSVVDNADSPRMRIRKVPDRPFLQPTPGPETQASWDTPPSIVQDSHPTNHAEFASLMSPTRVLENYLQHFESSQGSSNHDSQSNMLDTPYRHSSQYRSHRLSPKKLVPYSHQMIPCTPNIRNVIELPPSSIRGPEHQNNNPRQQPEAPGSDGSDDTIIEETRFLSSSQLAELPRADSEPPAKLRRLDLVTSPRALGRAASDIGPQSSLPKNKAPVTFKFPSKNHGFTYESLELRPREPPISISYIEPQDLITERLRKAAHDAGWPSKFRLEQTRELRPYERGHWLLDCSSWDPELKYHVWAYLADFIADNRSTDWGFWCKRDPAFKELRAYCWGSVVPHIYCVLYLSSPEKISFTGSAWIDAEGERIVVMGPKNYAQR